jgi:acid phosphatase
VPESFEDVEEGHDKGSMMMQKYRATYMPAIRRRHMKQNTEMEFSDDEIYATQEILRLWDNSEEVVIGVM